MSMLLQESTASLNWKASTRLGDLLAATSAIALVFWILLTHLTEVSGSQGFYYLWWGKSFAWGDPWPAFVQKYAGPVRLGLEIVPFWWLCNNVRWLKYLLKRLFGRGFTGPFACRHCGYDLRATPLQCPECGMATPEGACLGGDPAGSVGQTDGAGEINRRDTSE